MKLRLFIFLLILCSASIFAGTGIGGNAVYDFSTTPKFSTGITVRQDTHPWGFTLNARLDRKYEADICVDDWIVNEMITDHLDYYVFWGLSAGFLKDDDYMEVYAGSRAGAGLDVMLFKRYVELFFQVTWNPYYGAKINRADNTRVKPFFRPASFPCSAGMRFWM